MKAGVRLCAPAKVNLALQVGSRRPDGYHDVRTVLQALALHDTIQLRPAPDLDVRADDPRAGQACENLAWQAADALRRAAGIRAGARLRIRKRIPVQAGLGGGSSDAAAALVGCNRLWGLRWARERLAELGAALGADVPFFLLGGTAFGAGRGERVRRLPPLPAWPLLLCLTGSGVATRQAYAALDAVGPGPPVDVQGVVDLCRERPDARSGTGRQVLAGRLGNSFETAVLPLRPDIAALRLRMLAAGAVAALLCGSGAAVCALAPSEAWARAQAQRLGAQGLWAVATRLSAARAGFWPPTGRRA